MNTRSATSTTRPSIECLTLAGGWHAQVVTDERDATFPFDRWRPALEQLVTDAEHLPGYEVLKYSPDGEVIKATPRVGDQTIEIVCKRSGSGRMMRRLARLVGPTREGRGFAKALNLRLAGIPTAEPLALVERGGAAWLITRFLHGLVDLDQVALTELPRLDAAFGRRVRNTVIDALADLFATLELKRLRHRDLKASNILLHQWNDPERVSVWLVDLEGLTYRKAWHGSRRWQPLIRLAASLEGYAAVSVADHARTLRRYLVRTDGTDAGWRDVFQRLVGEVASYGRRSRRRKSHKLDGYTGA